MKHCRILPAAAGVIALTAATFFAYDQPENEKEGNFRTRIMVHSLAREIPGDLLPALMAVETGRVYLVEVEHGNKTKEMAVDAHTGQILGKRDIPVKGA